MSFTTHSYSVSFVMPAFLGNAEQQGQWRTPPFKALLRQWWRVANAHDCDYDVAKLAKAEGELFGVASDDKGGGSRRSRVQIRLHSWRKGAMTSAAGANGSSRSSAAQPPRLSRLWRGRPPTRRP